MGTVGIGIDPVNDTSGKTTVGHSVESQAQMRDAAEESSRAVRTGETLGIYKLLPIAAPNDQNWDIAPSRGNVVVAARTTGDARVVAAAFEVNFMRSNSAHGDDIAAMGASAFRNEKLYTVIEIDRNRVDLARGVMEVSDAGPIALAALRADYVARSHVSQSPGQESLARWENEGGAAVL